MELKYKFFVSGYCNHPEFITIKGGSFSTKKYPALCALIIHPKYGNILFDTGYSPRFFDETKLYPFNLYKYITPVHITQENILCNQLKQVDIERKDINYIFLSHLHADHIGGLKDFPNAQIILSKKELIEFEKTTGKFGSLLKGHLAGLLPTDFKSRITFIENSRTINLDASMFPFREGIDIFNDKSLIAIPLLGHSAGQTGLLFKSLENKTIFLVADSCWSSKAYRDNILPSKITNIIHYNASQYELTLGKLHELSKNNKAISIIPSHCQEVWQEIQQGIHG